MASAIDKSPACIFLNHVLQNAFGHGAEKLHFERRVNEASQRTIFGILREVDGACEEMAIPPAFLWLSVISRLKVMARMVDYGPNKSESGDFTLTLKDGRVLDIHVTSNPNPHVDTKVTLINKSCDLNKETVK